MNKTASTISSIDPQWLGSVTGGTTKTSSSDQQLTLQMQTITGALDDLKRNSTQTDSSKYLPLVMMMAMKNR